MRANLWKTVASIVVATLVDVVLHRFFGPRIEYNFPPSIFVQKGLFLPAAGVALIFLFGVVAMVFTAIQENMPGTKAVKGARFGIAFGVLCFVSIIEMSLIFDSSLADELRTAAIDGVSLLLLGLLLAGSTDSSGPVAPRPAKRSWTCFILVPLFFLIGRYFSYALVHILSAYSEKPGATFLWTLGVGLWIGVMYRLLGENRDDVSTIKAALRFGVLVFGSYWLIYSLFVLLFVNVSILDVVIRVLIDVVFVSAGIWAVKVLEQIGDKRPGAARQRLSANGGARRR